MIVGKLLQPSRKRLARRYGWTEETQRLALLHASDPCVRLPDDLERKIRRFVLAR